MSDVVGKEVCPCCGQTINRYEIVLNKSMVRIAVKIYNLLKPTNQTRFTRKEIIEVSDGAGTAFAMFGYWVYFGGLFYKEKKGSWGINFERCEEFFSGKRAINSRLIKKVKGAYELTDKAFIWEIKGISHFLNDEGKWISKYTD